MTILVREDDAVALEESASDGVQEQSFDSASVVTSSGITRQGAQVQNEIVWSEENYVKELRTLVMVFLKPLEMWAAEGVDEVTITSGDIKEIFSNAKDILAFNKRLLHNFETDCENEKCFGATFLAARDMYEAYSVYVKNYAKALKRLASCEDCSLFKAFVRACEFQEACHGLDLRAYLIQPIQRVPRYRLLLMELLKQNREFHPDWAILTDALEHISRIATKLDEDASDSMQLMRALELQDEFGESFLKPSSRLVKEGLLHKVFNGGPRPYKFVLFNDTLIYGTETLMAKLSRTVDQRVSDYRKYKAHRRIPLHDCLVLDDPDSSDAFVIARRGEGKSFLAMAPSAEEKQEWVQAFEECFARIADVSRASEGASSLESAASSREDFDDELTGSPGSDGCKATPDSAVDSNEHSIAASAAGGEESSSDGVSRTKPWSSSVQFPMSALAQSVSATMSSRLSFGYGKGVGEWSTSRTSTATSITPAFQDSSIATTTATSGGRISLDARPASCVQVWMLVDGRTEMQEVSLPPGYDFGVFKVRRPATAVAEDETTGVSTNTSSGNACGAEADGNGVANNRTSSVEKGNLTQSRPRSFPEESSASASLAARPAQPGPCSFPKERRAKRSKDRGSILKMLAIIEQGTLGVTMASWPQGKGSSAEENTETKPSMLPDQAECPCDDSIQSEGGQATDGPEEDIVSSGMPLTSSDGVQIEYTNQMHGPDGFSLESNTEPGQPAADVSETCVDTPVTSRRSSRDNSRAYYEAGSVGDPADYDGQESSAAGDGQDVPESEGSRLPRFLRSSRSLGARRRSKTPPVAERSRSPAKSERSTPAANILSSFQRGLGNRLQVGRSRSIPAGCRGVWETSAAVTKKRTDQTPAADEPRRRNSVSGGGI